MSVRRDEDRDGAPAATAIAVVSPAYSSVLSAACQNFESARRSRYGLRGEDAARFVERAVAERGVEERDERAQDETGDDTHVSHWQRPRGRQAAAAAAGGAVSYAVVVTGPVSPSAQVPNRRSSATGR